MVGLESLPGRAALCKDIAWTSLPNPEIPESRFERAEEPLSLFCLDLDDDDDWDASINGCGTTCELTEAREACIQTWTTVGMVWYGMVWYGMVSPGSQ
ncbi:hypothetical protein AC578_8277 [Pseudocercospora eumusae]|uniref:Uncharacterized protein n=1 Tax=Pseudocercospora eumusae TaxID=321146 RepID=A0A139HE76_9PEZI|nr:hypothetical protein AC578_8277 [Pseudocercospora eumusae]